MHRALPAQLAVCQSCHTWCAFVLMRSTSVDTLKAAHHDSMMRTHHLWTNVATFLALRL